MKGAVVTGATGAIGISLLNLLHKEKVPTLVLLHKDSKRNKVIPISEFIEIKYCNMDEYETFNCEHSYEVFFHMAWQGGSARNDIETHMSNVKYALDAVKLAKRVGCSKFVFAGSQSEYGLHVEKLTGSTPCFPTNVFGASKNYAGYITKFMAQELNMEHIWCRILSVYGPNDRETSMVSSVIRALLNGEVPKLTECTQIWDYLYCDDAAEALYLCAERGRGGAVYPIGSGENRALREYVNEIRSAIDPSLEIGFGQYPNQRNQVMYLSADISELQKDTGFYPHISFKEGIAKTVEWEKTIVLKP